MSSWDKFKESLPPLEAFYSKLNMSKISEDDYQHAQRVWKEFGIQNLGDYHDLYLRELMWSCWQMFLKLLEIPA